MRSMILDFCVLQLCNSRFVSTMKSVSPQRCLFSAPPFLGVVSSVVCMMVLFDMSGYADAAAFMQIAPVPLNSELLSKENRQSRNPYPMEVQEWQRQVNTLYQEGKYFDALYIQKKIYSASSLGSVW